MKSMSFFVDSVKLNYIKRREYTIDERVESCFYPGDVYTPDPAVNLTMAEMKAKKDLAAAINKRCRKVLSMKVGVKNRTSPVWIA